VTYVFGTTGESSLKKAFAAQGLEPNVVFTARDADIIKTYVRMGMGVGIVAPMAYECQDRKDLTAISAAGLFPRVTTWLGFRRDSVLRRYMVEFVTLFAPHLTPHLTRKAAQLPTQAEVDALFDEETLPLRVGCEEA
jgi:LysR family cys regulon transcriptional activator